MPRWKCASCRDEFDQTEKPLCSKTLKCKNGRFVNPVVKKEDDYDHAAFAEQWLYQADAHRTVNKNYSNNSGGLHKPAGTVYVRGEWAISPDVSTHSSGRAF